MAIPFVTSKNSYFKQEFNKLRLNWTVVNSYLITQGYEPKEIEIYKKAYFFFVIHPNEFDGATMTEDLYDVFNLDLDAMLHDFFYLKYNVSASYKFTELADKLFYVETLRKGKSSWNAGVRNVLLRLKSWIGFHLYVKYVLKRVMTEENKESFQKDFDILYK